jgi:hypothetical protein
MIRIDGGSTAARINVPPASAAPKSASTKAATGQADSFQPAAKNPNPPVATSTPPGPIPVGSNGDKVNAQTTATYTVGPATAPPMHFDNGFLQNPNDPNDPNPIATVPPTADDRSAKDGWERKLALGKAAQGVPFVPHNNIPDALDAYDHFLNGHGEDRTVNYDKYLTDDPSGKTTLTNATRDIQAAAEAYYKDAVAKDPSLAGKPITFQLTGTAIGAGGTSGYPYPETENWQKAIGAHQLWNSATVTVQPPSTPGGKPQFSMQETLHMADRYNFNPGSADINTGTPDAENGRFERTGLAHQYMNYGTAQRNVTWNQGDVEHATSTPVNTR